MILDKLIDARHFLQTNRYVSIPCRNGRWLVSVVRLSPDCKNDKVIGVCSLDLRQLYRSNPDEVCLDIKELMEECPKVWTPDFYNTAEILKCDKSIVSSQGQ